MERKGRRERERERIMIMVSDQQGVVSANVLSVVGLYPH